MEDKYFNLIMNCNPADDLFVFFITDYKSIDLKKESRISFSGYLFATQQISVSQVDLIVQKSFHDNME